MIISTNQENQSGDGYLITSDDFTVVVSQNITVLGSGVGNNGAGNGISNYDTNSNISHINNNVYNYGNIISDNEDGIKISSDFASHGSGKVVNGASGSIYGSADGVYIGQDQFYVDNAGNISSGFIGVSSSGLTGNFENSGIISGQYEGVYTQCLDSSTFHNTGKITGVYNGLVISGYDSSTSARIENAGLIGGGSYAIRCFDDVKTQIINTGRLDGDVQLGNGPNTFDGRGGSVNGSVIGGTGKDTIYAGSDGESLAGGRGHDNLYAGSGADSFTFASFQTADRDNVYDFDALHDIIRLNHAKFTKLREGATPEFSNASSATSATDHLFYNAANGGLYYDADGNRPGAAQAIAKLDTGLTLTAHDFKVF